MEANITDHALRRRGQLQVAAGSALISFSAVFVQLSDMGPTIDAFYRMFLGGGILLIIALLRKMPVWTGSTPFFYIVLCACCVAIDLVFWHLSIGHLGPGLATIIGNFQVFVLAFFGIFLFKERVGWKFMIAIPLVLVGMYFLVGEKWFKVSGNYQIGVYQALVTALFYGIYIVYLRKSQSLSNSLGAMPNLAWISLIASFILVGVALWRGESFVIPDMKNGMWAIGYALCSQVFGWVFISKGLPHVRISVVGFLILLQPSLSFLWDILIFGRPTPPVELLGVCITLFAIYLSVVGRSAAAVEEKGT